jgi:hypothetical protein
MVSFGTWRAYVGFGTEIAFGSTVTATIYIPALSYDSYVDDQGVVLDDAGRSVPTKVFAAYTGVRQGSWSATFPYYPLECARFWPRLNGSTDNVGSSSDAGWQHTFVMNSSSNPYTDTVIMFTGSTATERRFAGSAYTGMDFKFSRATGMATVKVSAISAAPSTVLTGEQSPTFPGATTGTGFNAPFRGWQATFDIGGTTQLTLQDFEFNVTREAELIFSGNNSRVPSAVEFGALDAKGKVTFYASTEKPYTDYQAGTKQSMGLVLTDQLPGSTTNKLTIQISKFIFTKVTPNFSGKYLTYDAEFQTLHSSSAGTDSGPFSIFTTVNSSATATG